jgi:predicted RecB family endonuclease
VSIIANEEAARKELLVEATEMMSTEDLIRMACTSISQAVLPVIEVLGRLTEKELGDLAGGGDDE